MTPKNLNEWLQSDTQDIGGNVTPDRVQSNVEHWDAVAERNRDLEHESRLADEQEHGQHWNSCRDADYMGD
jgi:hypothetical protein